MTSVPFALKRLRKIIQRFKSLLLKDFDPEQRAFIKAHLEELEKKYTNNEINFDEYKINSLAFLCSFRSLTWSEQFLYRETGNFFTQQEKFSICQLSEKIALSSSSASN